MYVELGRRYPTARAAVEPLEAAAAAAAGHAHSHPVGGVAVLPMPPMQRQGTPPVNAMLPAGPQVPVVTVAVAAAAAAANRAAATAAAAAAAAAPPAPVASATVGTAPKAYARQISFVS